MKKVIVRKKTLHESDSRDDLKGWSSSELIGIMWRLALDAWSFKVNLNAEPRLQRHVVVFKRGRG